MFVQGMSSNENKGSKMTTRQMRDKIERLRRGLRFKKNVFDIITDTNGSIELWLAIDELLNTADHTSEQYKIREIYERALQKIDIFEICK